MEYRNQLRNYANNLTNVEGSNRRKYLLQDHLVQVKVTMQNSKIYLILDCLPNIIYLTSI